MPRYDVHERDEIWVPAAPSDAYDAVKTVSAEEVKLFGPLMRLRMLGRWPGRLDTRAPLIGEMEKAGFVCGAIRRSWLKAIRRRLERTRPETAAAEP